MPASFIPVWMSTDEAVEFRRFLQEEARSTEGVFPDREFELVDAALEHERQRSLEDMESERHGVPLTDDDRRRLAEMAGDIEHFPASIRRELRNSFDQDGRDARFLRILAERGAR